MGPRSGHSATSSARGRRRAAVAAAPVETVVDVCSTGPCLQEFYMYRAQSDEAYPMENVNTGNLAGVLWYLHNEIVQSTPRKYDVTRVLRLKVTMKNTQELWAAHQSQ